MAHRKTIVWIWDGSGGRRVSLFHAYARWNRGVAYQGEYAKGAVRKLAFLPRAIRGRRYRPLRVGHRARFILIRGWHIRGIGFAVYPRAASLGGALLKKRGVLRSRYVFGPMCRPRPTRQFTSVYRVLV
jgi:hypothetical protein